MLDNTTPEGPDFGAMILGELDGEGDDPVVAAGHDPDAAPDNLPPIPSASEMAAAGAEYIDAETGFTLPAVTYHNRAELYHLMTSLVGDETRALGHLYRQGRLMVRVDDEGAAPLAAENLAAEIEKRMTTVKRNGKGESVMDLFPLQVAKLLAASPHLCEHIRELAGVSGVPLFRPDGSMLCTDGYDDVTRYVLRTDLGLEWAVSEAPSEVEVHRAVQTILEPIAGFPFVSGADRNAWIGMALTPMLRFIAPGPYKLGLIEAKQAGSGKSFLASMLAELHGGDVIPNLPAEDAELRKTVTSVLQTPSGVVVFDNVEGRVSSPTLAALLTTPKWSDRLLGRNTKIQLNNDRMWVATGNNITIDGDMARRVLRCVIDPGMPNPELREFDVNPVEWIREHRSAYLSALGVLIRAWVVRGMPLGDSPGSDSYARWRKSLDGILECAGISGGFDPQENRVQLGASDADWGTFLEAIHDVFADRAWRMAEVSDAIAAGKIDPELLPGSLAAKWTGWATPGFTKSLGRWALNRDGKWVGSYTLAGAGEDRRVKIRLWRVGKRAGLRGYGVTGLTPRRLRGIAADCGVWLSKCGV